MISSILTELYNPKAFVTHAALLCQGFTHCTKFPTAASRRSLDRVSVPVWLIILSDQLTIRAMVGHYPTIKLMVRGPILKWKPKPPLTSATKAAVVLCGISVPFETLSPSQG